MDFALEALSRVWAGRMGIRGMERVHLFLVGGLGILEGTALISTLGKGSGLQRPDIQLIFVLKPRVYYENQFLRAKYPG